MIVLKQLFAPCGLIWLGLMVNVLTLWRLRRWKLLGWNAALLMAYTVLGNVWLGGVVVSSLNARYSDVNSLDCGQFDAVCVLGGATSSSPHGRAQLNSAGDRVMLGARLYLTGRTSQLICTGHTTRSSSRDPAEECAEIWQDLRMPDSAVTQLRGTNTQEEMRELLHAVEKHKWKRVGLVTSCWHMPRAMEHATSVGLELVPLPASVSRERPQWSFLFHTIPQAHGLQLHQIALKEIAGMAATFR